MPLGAQGWDAGRAGPSAAHAALRRRRPCTSWRTFLRARCRALASRFLCLASSGLCSCSWGASRATPGAARPGGWPAPRGAPVVMPAVGRMCLCSRSLQWSSVAGRGRGRRARGQWARCGGRRQAGGRERRLAPAGGTGLRELRLPVLGFQKLLRGWAKLTLGLWGAKGCKWPPRCPRPPRFTPGSEGFAPGSRLPAGRTLHSSCRQRQTTCVEAGRGSGRANREPEDGSGLMQRDGGVWGIMLCRRPAGCHRRRRWLATRVRACEQHG